MRNSIINKLDYIIPNMIVTAIYTISYNKNIDGYNLIYKIIDQYTYDYPDIKIKETGIEINLTDKEYKPYLAQIKELNNIQKIGIIAVIEYSNELFLNNIFISMQKYKDSINVASSQSLIYFSIEKYIKEVQNIPLYNLIYFKSNTMIKNSIMLNFFLCLNTGVEDCIIISKNKSLSDILVTNGLTDSQILNKLTEFVTDCICEDTPNIQIKENILYVEWIKPNYMDCINKLFNKNMILILNERLNSFNMNMSYMYDRYRENFTGMGSIEEILIMSLNEINNIIENSPFYSNFSKLSTTQNIVLSYLY